MIEPKRAPVRPRVRLQPSGEVVLLEEVVAEHLGAGDEQKRKANLRGADLRGADITDVDFYLVDLREALYDHSQRDHLRRCGAILETRTRDD